MSRSEFWNEATQAGIAPPQSDESDESSPKTEDFIGAVIANRYRVEKLLGEGGMGAVFACHHLGLHKAVALKLLHPAMSNNAEVTARFEREAQSASRLEHPNCVRVLDFGTWSRSETTPPIKYLVMELLRGHELAELLTQKLSVERSVSLIDQVLAGLEHAHERGIVHRDLKPENVFVSSDHEGAEVLKLVDFGIAKIVQGEGSAAQLTQMGLVFGTPSYMSPEQATGDVADPRTDIYAAGVLLYRMLAGRLPFENENLIGLLHMQVHSQPPALPDTVPPAVQDAVRKMLAKQREDRFDATSARQALQAALQVVKPAPVVTLPSIEPAAADLSRPAPSRFQRWAPAAAAAVVAIVTAVVLVGRQSSEQAEPASAEPGAQAVVAAPAPGPTEQSPSVRAHTAWARGKAMHPHERDRALAAYIQALTTDPLMLEEKLFAAELDQFIAHKEQRERLTKAVLEHAKQPGHDWLRKRLADDAAPLGYMQRHRVLTAVGPRHDLVSDTLHVTLDLWQAEDSRSPCEVFLAALETIAAEPRRYYAGTLHGVTPPGKCRKLNARLAEVRTIVDDAFSDDRAPKAVPRAYAEVAAKKRKKGGRRGSRVGRRLRNMFGG